MSEELGLALRSPGESSARSIRQASGIRENSGSDGPVGSLSSPNGSRCETYISYLFSGIYINLNITSPSKAGIGWKDLHPR